MNRRLDHHPVSTWHGDYHEKYAAIPAGVGMAIPPQLTFSLPASAQSRISESCRCDV